jgi:Zn-dependent protease
MPMKGVLPLFRLAGIRVYLHFTWFIVAALEVTQFAHRYHNPIWAALEYCALFGVVLLHEFGHAFACRQTGGEADTIVLWPLGGIAFVKPPARPSAYLWSIAAGPLCERSFISVVHLVRIYGQQPPLGNSSSRFLPVCSDRLVHERRVVVF